MSLIKEVLISYLREKISCPIGKETHTKTTHTKIASLIKVAARLWQDCN